MDIALIKKYYLLYFLIYALHIPTTAAETIAIQISARNGSNLYSEQVLSNRALPPKNQPIYIKMASNKFQAIKCKGAWGATKYEVSLIEGPGFKLYQDDKQLTIQVIEHRVINADSIINAISIHCIDAEPKQTITSIAEVVIDRAKNSEEILEFDNGYTLSYQYSVTEKNSDS
ncbi:hypothetical protein ACJJIK_18325 [Microbulbifer sp. ZKSA006]|uniref:hypothetical protein n=1 Tax=Microbulbifer sp. ZKSA006 TaxID=3243390 RepID=UPI00403A302F